MITMAGALAGMILGGIICFLQQQFGFIKLENSESFLIDAYPGAMQAMDFVVVMGIVFIIGFLASWYTSSKIQATQHTMLLKTNK
jgi:lipoprotein-releasing system permease protein